MADLTVSSDIDTFMASADAAAARGNLGLGGSQIGNAYVNSAAASAAITATVLRNVLENATIADLGSSGDFTVDNTNKRVTYTGTDTLTFLVLVTLSMTTSKSNVVASFQLCKTGVCDATTGINRAIGTGSDEGALALSGIFSLATNDYIELHGTLDSSTSDTITVTHAQFNVIPVR